MRAPKAAGRCHQRGFLMLAVIVGLLVIFGGFAASRYWDLRSGLSVSQEASTTQAMQRAKAALLNYLVENGRLPCPIEDAPHYKGAVPSYSNSDVPGIAPQSCGSKGESRLGLLPWRTLGLPPDLGAQCFWYAASGNMMDVALETVRVNGINNDANGVFQVRAAGLGDLLAGNALNADDNAVAVLIAPGGPSGAQRQTLSASALCVIADGQLASSLRTHYLDRTPLTINGVTRLFDNAQMPTTPVVDANNGHDGAGAVSLKTFVQGFVNQAYLDTAMNDRLAWITPDEWAQALSQHAARQAALALKRFYRVRSYDKDAGNQAQGFYPFAAEGEGSGTCQKGMNGNALPASCPITSASQTLQNGQDAWGNYATTGFADPASAKAQGRSTDPPDGTLKKLLADRWRGKIRYEVSPKCIPQTDNCNGPGAFLSDGSLTNLHTIVRVQGRNTSDIVAKAYTQ